MRKRKRCKCGHVVSSHRIERNFSQPAGYMGQCSSCACPYFRRRSTRKPSASAKRTPS